MSDVIRITTTMRIYLDNYKRAFLLYCQEHWEDDSIYPSMWEEVSNFSDSDLILHALNREYCYFKYDQHIKDL